MEELEKNETSTQAEENTVSLASAQALADALAKIEAYTPTTWVDNSSPDIDAEHLNKPEQAIKRVTDALNSAVDVIKDLQSQVTKNAGDISTVNNNLSNANSKITRLYSDMSNLNKKTFSTYMSGDKDTDSVIASKQSDPYWTLTFGSNDSIGTIPTLTNVHLFTVIHWYLNDSAAMEHAYDTTGKLIAYRYKQWWIGAWSEWAKA